MKEIQAELGNEEIEDEDFDSDKQTEI